MAPNRSARLGVEILDERTVPTVLNLATRGAEVVTEQFIVRQSAAGDAGDFTKFVKLQDWGTEEGYNTTARRTQFDEIRGPNVQSALRLGDVPVVTIGDVAYREFVLDINQSRFLPFLSLDQIRIYADDTSRFRGYHAGRLNGELPLFDLDAEGNKTVVLNGNLNRGQGYGDMTLLVRDSAFDGVADTEFVSLYSKFGGMWGAWATGGVESWSVRDSVPPPPPPTGTSSLSGRVFVDAFSNGIFDPTGEGDVALAGVTVTLFRQDASGVYVSTGRTATTQDDGTFSFTGLEAGTYRIIEAQPAAGPNGEPLEDSTDFAGIVNGVANGTPFGTDAISDIVLGENQNGTNYFFTELIMMP